MEYPILEGIREPRDLHGLSMKELVCLAAEIRSLIVSTVSRNGGHLASNLGVVELAIALHRVFDSPRDKLVWDVGHQCYAHKLLTGRRELFYTLRREGGLSGFPKFSESPHDAFDTGHASTSISAALGLLAGERLSGGEGRAVAIIGDGALTGGMAYEALSHAGQLGLPLVVVLNDNKMSISPNVGGLSKYLSRLSMKAKYQLFRRTFDAMVRKIPGAGEGLFRGIVRMKRAVKAVFYTDNFFVDLGFEYVGPIDGHSVSQLEQVFRDVRKLDRPVVIHAITRKGKGYAFAEDDPGRWHGVGAFSVAGGAARRRGAARSGAERRPSFTEVFGEALVREAERDRRVLAVTAAMEQGAGLSAFRSAFPDRFFDTGIAEEHAVTFAAALARQGQRPVVAIYSTFMQRAVDQVIHDAALQRLPVVFALDRAGFVGDDGETHQGLFDIGLFRGVPGVTIMAPASALELRAMLSFALSQPGPCVIRYPKAECPPEIPAFSRPLVRGRGVWVKGGLAASATQVCIAFTGGLCREAADAAKILEADPVCADLYNIRFISPVDEEYLGEILDSYRLIVIMEEGVKKGGFGKYVAGLAMRRSLEGGSRGNVLVLAVDDPFGPQAGREELLRRNRLDGPGVAAALREALRSLDLRDAGVLPAGALPGEESAGECGCYRLPVCGNRR